MKKKIFTLDDTLKIKGIAIILMIIHHLFRLSSFSEEYAIRFDPFTATSMAKIATFFKICVPLFVFLSGYGLLYSYKKMKDKNKFYISRYLKLMSIFWIVAILSYIFVEVYNGGFTKVFFKKGIWSGILPLTANFFGISGLTGTPNFCNHWWYIGASLIFIFLLPIIYNMAKKYGWLSVGLAIVILPRILGVPTISTTTALPYIFTFYLGMLFEDKELFNKISDIKINKIIKFFVYIILMIVAYKIYVNYSRNIIYEYHFGLVPVLIICFAYEFLNNIPVLAQLLKSLGKHSYIMYLVHGIALTNFKSFFYSFDHCILSIIVLTLISYLISVVITFILKKTGYLKLFDKITAN